MTINNNRMVTNAAAIAVLWLAGMLVALAQGAAIVDQDAVAASAAAGETAKAQADGQFRSLDEDVQSLKKEVLDLNRDLFLLEEELLFPANSQVAFFISMDVGEYFELDSVSLQIDGKEVANYLYTEREASALLRGGVHRVHMGNLKVGDHELIAVFTGKGPHVRDYRRGATMTFNKGIGAKYVEMEISDRVAKQQPEFMIREWE
ncbi:MAG: AraC family transcriptional regulator [Woeseiaceae bacterium]|nr:AraC family transcriptional regulator [Woeseiaceae bacterium]